MHEFILANFGLHINLNPDEQAKIVSELRHRMVPKRTMLLSPGKINRHIYFVYKGCLRVFYTDDSGADYNINFAPENWWACDIISFFREQPAMHAIQSLEDSDVYYFTLPTLERLLTAVPKLERFFRILTQNGYDLLQRRIAGNMSKTAEARYMQFKKSYPGLEQRISQRQVAAFLGITPAFLSMMRKKGKI